MDGSRVEQKVETAWLLGFYRPLLTENQQELLHLALEEDMSLSEIAASRSISPQAVHDAIRRGTALLHDTENKLHLGQQFLDMQAGIERALRLTQQIIPLPDSREAHAALAALLRSLSAAQEEEEPWPLKD